jgi:tetratricopeptide (TPR) repeat protein
MSRFIFFKISIITSCLILMMACGTGSTQKDPVKKDTELDFSEARTMLAEGKKLTEKADSLHQENARLLTEQTAELAYSKLYNLVEKAPSYRNAASAMLGQSAYLKRKFPEAERWLKEAMQLNNRDVKTLMWLGLTYLATSQPDTAREYFAKSITFFDEADHRERVVREIFDVGQTAFEYGVSYEQDGYPQKGFDYKAYGTYVVSMAYELDKEDSMPELKQQVVSYATVLLPRANEQNDEKRIAFFQNIINQLK